MLCLWTALCTGCMVVMLLFASNKTIVIADGYQEQPGLTVETGAGEHSLQNTELVLKQKNGVSGKFSIPLPKNIRAENVVVENRYMDRQLWIYFKNGELEWNAENEISGDISDIQSACSEVREDGILLKFQMNRVLEYKSTMESSILTFDCYQPEELYEFIIVLDPEGGGTDTGYLGTNLSEKDMALQVARLVQRSLMLPEVRLYLTRTEDIDVPEQERVRFAKEVNADLYICLGAEFDAENTETYGIRSSYNEEYFIPDLGNAELADVVTKAVTIAASNRALGLFAAEEGSVLRNLETRGVRIGLGYLSNPKEEALLAQESYQEKLAEGIAKAISEVCDFLRGVKNE